MTQQTPESNYHESMIEPRINFRSIRVYVASLGLNKVRFLTNFFMTIGSLSLLALILLGGFGLALEVTGSDELTHKFEWLGGVAIGCILLMMVAGFLGTKFENIANHLFQNSLSTSSRPLDEALRINVASILDAETQLANVGLSTEARETLQMRLDELHTERGELRKRAKLEDRLNKVSNALRNCLERTNLERSNFSNSAAQFRLVAMIFIIATVLWIGACVLALIRPTVFGLDLAVISDIRGQLSLSIALITFPVTIFIVLAGLSLRHDMKLTQEVRLYTLQQQHVELMSGLLSAAQYVDEPANSEAIIRETFQLVRSKLLAIDIPNTSLASTEGAKQDANEASLDLPIISFLRELNALRKSA